MGPKLAVRVLCWDNYFFTVVLGPGRCLDGFVPHFSCRYTPSDPKISILDPKSLKFHRKSSPPDPPKAPAVPSGLHLGLGMDLGWLGEGHMRSSMVNNSYNWRFLEHGNGSHRSHRSRGSRRSGVKKCGSEPQSTRAGGQDDGSYTNSLKLT